jgi:hypothetical protein
MSKQVKKAAAHLKDAAEMNGNPQHNLFFSVKTFESKEGKTIGERIVDLFHYGTRKWLQDHIWWAMHNSHEVEVKVATEDEIASYLASGKAALAEKFNSTAPAVTEAAAA